jgi:hypothetical protein
MRISSTIRRVLAAGIVALPLSLALGVNPASAHDGHSGLPAGRGSCPYYHVCVWEHANYQGPGRAFSACRTVNLVNYGFNDRASSIVNNQTPGTVSYFYDSSAPNISLRQHAYGYRDNLMLDYAEIPGPWGNNWNDRIDRISVC